MSDAPLPWALNGAEALAALYPDAPVARLGGRVCPVAVYPAGQRQGGELESVLGERVPGAGAGAGAGVGETELVTDEAHLAALLDRSRRAGRAFYDGTIAAMHGLDVDADGTLRMRWGPGSYFDVLRSADALAVEMHRALAGGSLDEAELLGALPLRRAVHELTGDPLRDGAGRCNGIGVTCVIAYRAGDGPAGYRTLLGNVSPRKPAHGGLLHALPSAMLEPTGGADVPTCSIRDTVLREYAEELFGCGDGDSQAWRDTDAVTALDAWLTRGVATLRLTGVAVSLWNLRPEICTVLRIDTPEFANRWLGKLAVNWEFDRAADADAVRSVAFDYEAALAADLDADVRRLVPPAAGALALALRAR